MKVAITISPDTERISPMFDTAGHIILANCCRNGGEPEIPMVFPSEFEKKMEFLEQHRIGLLICGAISNEDRLFLNARGIGVCPFASGPWREVWAEWKTSRRLKECHVLPGCCRHHRRCCKNKMQK